MSVTNAISSVIVVGALLALGPRRVVCTRPGTLTAAAGGNAQRGRHLLARLVDELARGAALGVDARGIAVRLA